MMNIETRRQRRHTCSLLFHIPARIHLCVPRSILSPFLPSSRTYLDGVCLAEVLVLIQAAGPGLLMFAELGVKLAVVQVHLRGRWKQRKGRSDEADQKVVQRAKHKTSALDWTEQNTPPQNHSIYFCTHNNRVFVLAGALQLGHGRHHRLLQLG